MAKRSGKSFWIALASLTLIMLILAGSFEEFMIFDQPLISLIDQIMCGESETYGETYEGEDYNIPGGYGGSGTGTPSGYGGSTIADWGRILIVEDIVPPESVKKISVDDYLTIVFPSGSVRESSVIKVYRVENPTPIAGDWQPLLVYDVNLSSKLETSVTLELQLDLSEIPKDVDLNEIVSFAEYVQEYNTWVLIPTRIEGGKLVATVNHFSVKGVLIYTQKAVSFISDIFKDIGHKATDVYENAKDWIQSSCTETPHFRVCYTNATLTFKDMGQLKTVNTSTVAIRLGNALEIARDRYMKAGFKVPREKKNVYIVVGLEKNQYSIIWGNIYVQNAPTEEEMVLSAFHEFFHAVQDQYISMIYHMMRRSTIWVIESTADYAAYKIAAQTNLGSEFTLDYFSNDFTYVNGIQEYQTAHLLDYTINPSNLQELWTKVIASSDPSNEFISTASRLKGKPFTDIYYDFVKYMVFDPSSRFNYNTQTDGIIQTVEKLPLNSTITKDILLKSFTVRLILVKIETDKNKNDNRELEISVVKDSNDKDTRIGVFVIPTTRGSLSNERVKLTTAREVGVLNEKYRMKVNVNKNDRIILLIVAAPSQYILKNHKLKLTIKDASNSYEFGYTYSEEIPASTPKTSFRLDVKGSIQGLPEDALIAFQDQGVKEGNIYRNPPTFSINIKEIKSPITIKVTLNVETNLKKNTKINIKESQPSFDYTKTGTLEFNDPEYLICSNQYESSCTINLAIGSPATFSYDLKIDPSKDPSKTMIFTIRWIINATIQETKYGQTQSWEGVDKMYVAILVLNIKRD